MMTVLISMLLIIPCFISAEEINTTKNETVKMTSSGCINSPEMEKTKHVSTTVILIIVYLALWILTLVFCVFVYVKYIHRNYVSDSSTQTEKLDACSISRAEKGHGKLRDTSDCQFFVQIEQPIVLNHQSISKLEEDEDTPNKNYVDNGLIKPTYIDKLLLQGNEVGLPQMSISAALTEIELPEEEKQGLNEYNEDFCIKNMPVSFGNCSKLSRMEWTMVTIDEEDELELSTAETVHHAP